MKRFSSRNQRSKGIRVKHVLQILLLLGVCFWLIYQVKHNHDKKKQFDENEAKLSVRTDADQVLKLGRKDLHPLKDEVKQNEKHEEEEEDESFVEDEEKKHEHNEGEDEGNKHETEESEDNKHEEREEREEENKLREEEQGEDENRSDEMEDEGRGGGDDEIDENDQEKTEVDNDRAEELMDEEKEKEKEGVDDNEDENSEDVKKEGSVENHNTREAREEHYRGDDASSAVAHDTHTTSTETETFSLENSDVILEMNITNPEHEANNSDESNGNQNGSGLKVTEGELTERTASNATSGKEAGNNSLSNPADSSYLNKTVTTNSDSHLEAGNNTTIVITEASHNLSGAGADTSSPSEQNKTVILSESDHAQNGTVNTTITGDVKNVQTEGLGQSSNRVSEENLPDSDSTTASKTENRDVTSGESSILGAGELEETRRLVASNETENDSINESIDASDGSKSKGSSETVETQNIDATEDEMYKGDTQTGEIDEMSDTFSANGTLDSAEHDAIDSSDAHINDEVTKFRTDLDTLPDFRNEGEDGDEIAAG